jgi:uncharacterized membrane protein
VRFLFRFVPLALLYLDCIICKSGRNLLQKKKKKKKKEEEEEEEEEEEKQRKENLVKVVLVSTFSYLYSLTRRKYCQVISFSVFDVQPDQDEKSVVLDSRFA